MLNYLKGFRPEGLMGMVVITTVYMWRKLLSWDWNM
jgi:hypothetical protein